MRSPVEVLSLQGILPREFDFWHRISDMQQACDWIDPDPEEQMVFQVASEQQIIDARRRLEALKEEASDKLGLVRNPQVAPGQPVPPAPTGKRYFGDWYSGIKAAIIAANRATKP